jgi:hypothetical protein
MIPVPLILPITQSCAYKLKAGIAYYSLFPIIYIHQLTGIRIHLKFSKKSKTATIFGQYPKEGKLGR